MKAKRLLSYGLFFVLFFSLLNCAKRGTPAGGPKDVTPPAITSSSPKTNTTNFTAKKIRIDFDEYIKLKDLQKQLIVSPPLDNQPLVYPQSAASKYLEIELMDTLKENTTYVFNFGNSVVDNNEGNPYPFFNYVFSTGDYIDSLQLEGFVMDAVDKKPESFISVMLYEVDSTYTDSVIYQKPPTYITNTLDSSVIYRLTNLKEGKYRLIAMKDEANNYRFDPKTDKIGYLDHFIDIPNDSIYGLSLFKEVLDFKATRPSIIAKNKIFFGYEGDPEGMEIKLLSDKPDDYEYRTFPDIETDTINYFFTPFEADSLVFEVKNKSFIDTFTVRTKSLYPDTLVVAQLNKGFKLNDSIRLHASTPMESFNEELITVINKDSAEVEFTANLYKEKNIFSIKWDTQADEQYRITLLPGALEDFYGEINDTLNYSARTKSLADLGSMRVSLRNVDQYPLILQLTDNNGEVKEEIYVEEEKYAYEFLNIQPATYSIRVIHDTNGNGKWDTGNFLKKIQPERISYYPDPVELRPNWEIEQVFTLQSP
ncbi:Ig-like domain-containing protein [Galbibacter sp. EGI 63066]|uniref:Ig-like domain-containing protein n=1 Tax=Galbibacter sp. EGI 63066 TaxID=2993559 RepID=UPI002249290B|nr:Ig-like domain-containing protein [Galbibacter sp. EGI 63066]MCX2680540.1 Ig-like domain-containing protein [Galbibacter sp. EGI 63066]